MSLHDNDTVAIVNIRRSKSGSLGDQSKVPVVYLSESPAEGGKITFRVEYNYPRHVAPNYSFIFGVTTCDLSSIQNNAGHVDNVCGNDDLNCAGASKSLKITSHSRSTVKKVTIDRRGDSIRITVDDDTLFDLDSTLEASAHPFIILSGGARRIRICPSSTVRGSISLTEQVECKFSPLFLNKASNWVLSRDVALDNGCLFTVGNGEAAYAYLKKPFLLNQEIKFAVTKIDSSRIGSLCIGMTRVNPDELCLDFVPSDATKLQEAEFACDWKIYLDAVVSPSTGTTVTLFRDAYGLFIQDGCKMQLAFKSELSPSLPWYLFLLLSGKVVTIRFLPSKKPTCSPHVNAIDFSSDDESDDCIELGYVIKE